MGNEKMNQMILAASSWLNFNFITAAYMAVVNTYCNMTDHIARRANVRRTIKDLNRLSDRELDDMGICRGMIIDIAEGARPNV
jgi:uncharacterized protein YjiS (DUF1127 family)